MNSGTTMLTINDAENEDGEELYSRYLYSGYKPNIGEKFTVMLDHRGPYDNNETIYISGRVVDVHQDIFPNKLGDDNHLTVYLNVKKLTKWDANKGEPVEVIS